MTRLRLLTGLIVTAGFAMTVAAYQQQAATFTVEKVRDNLYVLRGPSGNGNTAVFIGTTGITVVDTKTAAFGQQVFDAVKALSTKPIVRIINTHTHGDHVGGNAVFPATVDVVVHENTRASMQRMAGGAGTAPGPFPSGRGMAKRTFTDRLTLDSGADQIDLYYFGRGHTNGDAWVVWPALRVMHAGDIFSNKVVPILDGNNGGSGLEIGDSLTRGADAVKNIDTIITGHGAEMTVADLREYAQFNKDFVSYVRAGIQAGKSVDALAAEYAVPAKYRGYQADPARVKNNVQLIAGELKAR